MPTRPYVSIAHVARRLGVEPDDVLEWVERGLLASTRTKAGYLRIPREQLDELLRARPEGKGTTANSEPRGHGCGRCCHGHRQRDAESAPLVQISKKPTPATESPDGLFKVLVVTDNAGLKEKLGTQPRPPTLVIEFASQNYECSAVVGRLHPHVVVLDCTLPMADIEDLYRHLASDPRVPGLKLVLANSGTWRPAAVGGCDLVELPDSFDVSDLEGVYRSTAR